MKMQEAYVLVNVRDSLVIVHAYNADVKRHAACVAVAVFDEYYVSVACLGLLICKIDHLLGLAAAFGSCQ